MHGRSARPHRWTFTESSGLRSSPITKSWSLSSLRRINVKRPQKKRRWTLATTPFTVCCVQYPHVLRPADGSSLPQTADVRAVEVCHGRGHRMGPEDIKVPGRLFLRRNARCVLQSGRMSFFTAGVSLSVLKRPRHRARIRIDVTLQTMLAANAGPFI